MMARGVKCMHYLVVASDVLTQFVITLADLERGLEHRLVIKVEPDDPVVPLQPPDAPDKPGAGAAVEGRLVEYSGNVADVGRGGEVKGLEVAVDTAQYLGVAVHDEDGVLVPPLDTHAVPHPEDHLLETAKDGGPGAEVVAELNEPVDNRHGEKIPPRLGPLLVTGSNVSLASKEKTLRTGSQLIKRNICRWNFQYYHNLL